MTALEVLAISFAVVLAASALANLGEAARETLRGSTVHVTPALVVTPTAPPALGRRLLNVRQQLARLPALRAPIPPASGSSLLSTTGDPYAPRSLSVVYSRAGPTSFAGASAAMAADVVNDGPYGR